MLPQKMILFKWYHIMQSSKFNILFKSQDTYKYEKNKEIEIQVLSLYNE